MAEGTPTPKTAEMLLRSGRPTRAEKVSTEPRPSRAMMMRKYSRATQLDRHVAIPAPSTSCPLGSRTNIKSGSRAILRRPPRIIPALASRERPTLRIRLESTLDSTVGMPPMTMTQRAYCRA